MKAVAWLLCLALYVAQTLAVKDYLFKHCDNSGFCHRNRHYAQQVASAHVQLPYSVDPESVVILADTISGTILKNVPDFGVVLLPFEISHLNGDSIRFKVDEDRRNVDVAGRAVERYAGAASAAFAGPESALSAGLNAHNVEKLTRHVKYRYGPDEQLAVELTYSPVKLTVSKNGVAQVVVNERGFFNVEHYRTKDENAKHLLPHESDFDMFADSFADCKDDLLPFGPEAIAADISLPGYTHVYGIPEHADSFSLKDTTGDAKWPYRLYNVDIFEYETDSRMPMYGTIPLLVGVSPQASVGVFWINSADTFVDIDKSSGSVATHWISENGVLDLAIIVADTPSEVSQKYGLITGNVELPQMFALGYHQCRWNYNDEDDVLDVHAKMDEHMIPYDTIWLDIEYTDQKKYFTWNEATFPTPLKMLQALDRTGRNLVVIIDPHLKTEYDVSDFVDKNKLAINDPQNNTYKGHCWPGESVWIDPLNSRAQQYWDSLFEYSDSNKFLGKQTNIHLWNDMNEPSFFNGPETSSPRDNVHYGDVEHRSVHNLWGKSFHDLTYDSLKKRLAQTLRQRPFVLTRSFFAGSQRTAAMWTGDNKAEWEYLRASIPMVLTLNAVNMPFSGADVGGFFGDPSKELLTRWYQAGIWYPFFRAHAHIDSRRREPWIAGEPYTGIIRDAVRLRYALLPTLYTLFKEASEQGAPIWKLMVYDNPSDLATYDIDDQFFLGNLGLLVKPVTDEHAEELSVYIPSNEVYYDYTNGKFNAGSLVAKPGANGIFHKEVTLRDIPVFVKGGSIFARKDRYRRSSQLMEHDPYHIVVGLDREGRALGKLYVDDGRTFDFENGKFLFTLFTAADNTISGMPAGVDRSYVEEMKKVPIEKISVAGVSGKIGSVTVSQNGEERAGAFRQQGSVVEILAPGVSVTEAWSVELHAEKGAVHDEL